jgi:hypothetical protein
MNGSEKPVPPGVLKWYRAAVIYLVAGAVLGSWMGLRENFQLHSVHAHLSLLGWVSMALIGLIYQGLPGLAVRRGGVLQFWLHNLALLATAGGLSAVRLGYPQAEPVLGVGSMLLLVALTMFAFNLVLGTRSPQLASADRDLSAMSLIPDGGRVQSVAVSGVTDTRP